MPFSRRSAPFETLLLGAFLILPGAPALAGNDDDRDGVVAARDIMESVQDETKERTKLFFGERDGSDRKQRQRWVGRESLVGLEEPGSDLMRNVMAEELLDGLEDRLNEGKWIPFRHRKGSGPELLASLDETTPDEPAAADSSFRSRFRLSLVRGLEYRQEFTMSDQRKVKMRVYGPVVPGGPGLGLQLRGRLWDRGVRLNAYGGTNEAALTVDIEF